MTEPPTQGLGAEREATTPAEMGAAPPPPGEAAGDDAPTIISRRPPAGGELEEVRASLRGKRLAHYELVGPLGVGGMATVVEARDMQLERRVALKILPPGMALDREAVRRFQQEARAAAKLDHENVARVYYSGEDQGLHFIAYEFVEGENLRALMERRGRLPVGEATRYVLQAAEGLAHAAARGVVHRDIKPSNIVITPEGRAKLVDLGLARELGPSGDAALTESGITLGTFDYISPEQALEPRQADFRSDVYSLGCTWYHLITGQPPVPEGTAARKLNHHQYVAPLDPRELNPEVPDAAADVLARMMAKDPADRYQDPDELARDLRALERGWTVEPNGRPALPPAAAGGRGRALALAALAATVAGGLIGLQEFLSRRSPAWSGGVEVARAGRETTAVREREAPPAAPAAEQPEPERTAVPVYEVASGAELVACVARNDREADIVVGADLDLRADVAEGVGRVPGLTLGVAGRKVTIRGRRSGGGKRLTAVRLAYDARVTEEGFWAALTVRGGTVTVRDLRFEVDAREAPGIRMAALRFEGAGRLTVRNCEFLQAGAAAGSVGSVVVDGGGSSDEAPVAALEGCYFGAAECGQAAVQVVGPAVVEAMSCAFGPHGRVFDLGGRADVLDQVTLKACSVMLKGGTVFWAGNGVRSRFDVADCVFSGLAGEANTALVRQDGGRPDAVEFTGEDNRYFGMGPYWERQGPGGKEAVAPTAEAFRAKVRADDDSLEVGRSPWEAADPLRWLHDGRPERAFRLDVARAELRQAKRAASLVGVRQCVWGPTQDEHLPPLTSAESGSVRVVDPRVRHQEGSGRVYRTLNQAVLDANPGDVIEIRFDGELAVDPVRLEKPTADLTIRPYPKSHPVLTVGETADREAAIFRVNDGVLRLEQVQFRLKPAKRDFLSQAVVAVAGNGQCRFRQCVVTLEGDDAETVGLAAVVLADPREVMRMGAPAVAEVPALAFEETFVRGRGDLVAVRASRPFELSAEDSLFALGGCLLSVEAAGREAPSGPPVQVSLDRVTAYLGGHLVELRTSQEGRDLVPVQVKAATRCLFASAGRKSLVHFEGEMADEQKVRARFTWDGGGRNAYGNYESMVDQQPTRGEGMPLAPMGRERWTAVSHEDARWVDRVRFAGPVEEKPLQAMLPGDFRPVADGEQDLRGFGAQVEAMPRPAGESRAGWGR